MSDIRHGPFILWDHNQERIKCGYSLKHGAFHERDKNCTRALPHPHMYAQCLARWLAHVGDFINIWTEGELERRDGRRGEKRNETKRAEAVPPKEWCDLCKAKPSDYKSPTDRECHFGASSTGFHSLNQNPLF